MVQYWCTVEHLFDVGPGAFSPPPKVDSHRPADAPRPVRTPPMMWRCWKSWYARPSISGARPCATRLPLLDPRTLPRPVSNRQCVPNRSTWQALFVWPTCWRAVKEAPGGLTFAWEEIQVRQSPLSGRAVQPAEPFRLCLYHHYPQCRPCRCSCLTATGSSPTATARYRVRGEGVVGGNRCLSRVPAIPIPAAACWRRRWAACRAVSVCAARTDRFHAPVPYSVCQARYAALRFEHGCLCCR